MLAVATGAFGLDDPYGREASIIGQRQLPIEAARAPSRTRRYPRKPSTAS